MSEWIRATLGDLTLNFDAMRRPVKSSDRQAGEYPYFGASGVIDWVDGYTHDGEYLLIAEDGENLRSRNTPIAFMSYGKAWINNHAHVVTGNGRAVTKFLCYMLANTDISGFLSGSAQPKLSKMAMESIPLLVPPLLEQQAIAEVLGALDDKIAANNRISDLASNLAATMFQSAIEGSKAMTRSSIRTLSAEGLLTYGDGYRTKRAEHGQPGMQIVRAGDIRGGRLVLSGSDFVSSDYLGSVGPKTCRPGDIVLTTKGTVGRVATVQDDIGPSVYSPQLCYFRMTKKQSQLQPWFAEWLRSADRIRQTDIAMHKSDMAPYVNLQDIGALQVPIPNDDSYCSIIEQLGTLHQLGHAMARENKVLANTRDELLPLLMSGKLRVKDAENKVEEIA